MSEAVDKRRAQTENVKTLANTIKAYQQEIADLQRQLQQAQEYRAEDKRKMEAWAARCQQAQEERENRESLLAQTTEAMEGFAAERDAAIERGHDALWDAFEAYLKYYEGWGRQKRRAEAAERELAEQRALVWRDPERLAKTFHEAYERLAVRFGYKTRKASSGRWEQVPDKNKRLMIATCRAVIDDPAEAQEEAL